MTLQKIPTEQLFTTLEFQTSRNDIDYVEALVFADSSVVCTGIQTNSTQLPIVTCSQSKDPWCYLLIQQQLREGNNYFAIPARDYEFRYKRGAFWMGTEAFAFMHLPFNRFTRWLLDIFMHTRKLYDGLHEMNIMQHFFIQDVYMDRSGAEKCLQYNEQNMSIYPIWICPMRSASSLQKLSPHYTGADQLLYDVGLYGKPIGQDIDMINLNRRFEHFIADRHGRKMLYAETFYTESEFWSIYDRVWYDDLRMKYHAELFPSVYEKTKTIGRVTRTPVRGAMHLLRDLILGKTYGSRHKSFCITN